MMGSGDEEEEVGAELRAVLNDGEEVECFLLAAGAQDSEGSDASKQQAFPTQGAARREFMALIKHRRRHHEYAVLVGTLGNEQDPMAKVTLAFPVLESTAVKVCLDEHRTDANNMALATGISIDGDVVDKGRVTSMRYEFSCDPSGASTDAIHSFILATHEAMDIASQHRFRSISVSHTWVVHRKSWAPSSRDDRGRASDDDNDDDGDDDDDGGDDDTGRMRWNSRTEQHMLSFVQHRNITDQALLQMWKEEWIRSELARRQDEYTDYEPLNICVGTFNVNGRKPDTSLAPWLLSGDHDSVDLFILGFQEVDLSKEAYVFESKREEEWVTVINSILSPLGYVKLRSKQLVGMLLLAFTRRELLPHVGQVSTCAMGTGVMNMLGNKGGVGFSIPFRDSHLCFLNTHLAAHDDNVARRNQNHHDLCKGISFRTGARTRTIFDHDYLFWLGDLNYRIDLFDATIKAAVQKMNLEELLEHDQLRTQQRIGAAFTHFVEPAIAFAPTYKYDIGTSTFDTSEKQRSPAYCDRILFYQPPDGTPLSSQVSVLEYTSAHAITISDHKPVRGRFRLNLRVINEERRRATRALVVRELDVIENSALPDVTLDSQELHFPHVHVGEKYTQQLTIANVGKVVAHFQFAAKDGEKEPHPRWMHVDCGAGFVMPGHKATITITVEVDAKTAATLNTGEQQLDDTLILALRHGSTKFISVHGDFVPTCLGRTLEDLCYLKRPARWCPVSIPHSPLFTPHSSLPAPPNEQHRGRAWLSSTVRAIEHEGEPMFVPKELWLLVDFIIAHGVTKPALMQAMVSDDDVRRVIRCLDMCEEIPAEMSASCALKALILFLESLADPVVPFSMYTQCLDHANAATLSKRLEAELPTAHRLAFEYLIRFVDTIIQHRDQNDVVPDVLVAIFARVLLRSPREDLAWRETNLDGERKVMFIKHFLSDDTPTALPFV